MGVRVGRRRSAWACASSIFAMESSAQKAPTSSSARQVRVAVWVDHMLRSSPITSTRPPTARPILRKGSTPAVSSSRVIVWLSDASA
jgi:hypothetical protein